MDERREIDHQIGRNVAAELGRARLQQRDLEAVLGVSQSGISERIRGRRSFRGAELVLTARLLEIPIQELFIGLGVDGR